jgi:hypothetical protein
MQRILDPKMLYGLIGIARASDHDAPYEASGSGRARWAQARSLDRPPRPLLPCGVGTVAVGAIVWEAFGGTAEAWVMSPMLSGLAIAFGRDRESALIAYGGSGRKFRGLDQEGVRLRHGAAGAELRSARPPGSGGPPRTGLRAQLSASTDAVIARSSRVR